MEAPQPMAEEPSDTPPVPAPQKPPRRRTFLLIFRSILTLTVLFIVTVGYLSTSMPGRSYRGPLPPLTPAEGELRDELRHDVERLATAIGERNTYTIRALIAAGDFIAEELKAAGYTVEELSFETYGQPCRDIAVEPIGRRNPEQIVIVGAHYDTAEDCPGANDNASAVAALLALARRSYGRTPDRTLRFVAFTNEEPPWFKTSEMGSLIYARRCQERGERIVAMLSLETMGYYSDAPGSQKYPLPFGLLYPSQGNFIGFVGSLSSRAFVRDVVGLFRRHVQFPSEGAALPAFIEPAGWSDHWAFWQIGCPALMVTDTAPFRYPFYHDPQDLPEKLDYARLARVVTGLAGVIDDLTATATDASK